jgi:hypothetical protein
MFIRLKEKPYYFITDRTTKYTFLVDNRPPSPAKHLYLPEQWETMTAGELRTYKWKLVRRFMWWSLFAGELMTRTDRKIAQSKIMDLGFTVLTGLFLARFARKALFRMQLPFFEMATRGGVFSARWIKSALAYSLTGAVTYKAANTILKEDYLVDLAFEYRPNFDTSLTCA